LGEWENCDQLARAAGLPEDRILQIYSEAVTWAEINMSLAAD